MKKLLVACCALCCFTGFAMGDTWCGLECSDASGYANKTILCLTRGGDFGVPAKCLPAGWKKWDGVINCDKAVPDGMQAVTTSDSDATYVSNDVEVFNPGTMNFKSFVEVVASQVCWGCMLNYHFDGDYNCVPDETSEEFCGAVCDAAHQGQYVVCPQSEVAGKESALVKSCQDDGSWADIVAKSCGTDYIISRTDVRDVGKYTKGALGEHGLMWVDKKVKKTGKGYVFNDNVATNFCEGCQQGYKWDATAAKCVSTKKSSRKPDCPDGVCDVHSETEQLGEPCRDGQKVNDACTPKKGSGATKAICLDLSAVKKGSIQLTCAHTECDDNHLLSLDPKGNSRGICHTKKHAYDFCANNRCGCDDPNEKCVPWIVETPRTHKKDGAYRECHCEKTSSPVVSNCETKYPDTKSHGYACCKAEENGEKIIWNKDKTDCTCPENQHFNYDTQKCEEEESDCVYNFSGTVLCSDGKKHYIEYHDKLPKSVFDNTKKQCTELNTRFAHDVTGLHILAQHLCRKNVFGGGNGHVSQTDYELQSAIEEINKFFETTNANKNVWRDEEGKFNTTRLASDATAGVVLGTVGGIVSSKVIKKKQLEKGYDALQCTVGGQKIADYGDTFRVSFYR